MSQHEYYQLWFSEGNPDPFLASLVDLQGVDEYFVYRGAYVEEWPLNITFVGKGRNPTDYLVSAPVSWTIVSKRVQQAFADCKIEGVQFLPVSVQHESGIRLPGYSLLNVLNIIPALDYKRTRWLTPDKENVEHVELNIVQVALRGSAICGYDIFRIREDVVSIFVSQRVVECLEAVDAMSGFRFDPITVT